MKKKIIIPRNPLDIEVVSKSVPFINRKMQVKEILETVENFKIFDNPIIGVSYDIAKNGSIYYGQMENIEVIFTDLLTSEEEIAEILSHMFLERVSYKRGVSVKEILG